MKFKGIALISPKIKNRDRIYVGGIEKYEAQVLDVTDRNENGDILALSNDHKGLGDILAEDVLCFLPLIKENGIIIPVELEGSKKMEWFAAAHLKGIEKFNIRYIAKCIATQKVSTDLSFIYE